MKIRHVIPLILFIATQQTLATEPKIQTPPPGTHTRFTFYNPTQYLHIKKYNIHVMGTRPVSEWMMRESYELIQQLVDSLKNPEDRAKYSGHQAILVTDADPDLGGIPGHRNTGGRGFSLFNEALVCTTSSDTIRPDAKPIYRAWNTPVHEFGHSIEHTLQLEKRSDEIYSKNARNYNPKVAREYFAWGTQRWFACTENGRGRDTMPDWEFDYFSSIFSVENKWVPSREPRPAPEKLDLEVPLGGNIQQAIDRVAKAGGGTVSLAKGVHTISKPILIRSNVTLEGAGAEATTLRTDQPIKLIVQASEGLRNITIRDLNLIGVAADSSLAIHIISMETNHKNIRLFRVHASQTGWGVHIKGAIGVAIRDCEFTQNGCKGREGYAHNLYLRRCEDVLVEGCKLNDSPSGNGCNISYSKNVVIDRCEVLNNYFRGIRAADTDGFMVRKCKIGGNGNVGLIANREKTPTQNINFTKNVVFNNSKGGIQAKNGVTGRIIDCTSYENQAFDFDVNSNIKQRNNRTTEQPNG